MVGGEGGACACARGGGKVGGIAAGGVRAFSVCRCRLPHAVPSSHTSHCIHPRHTAGGHASSATSRGGSTHPGAPVTCRAPTAATPANETQLRGPRTGRPPTSTAGSCTRRIAAAASCAQQQQDRPHPDTPQQSSLRRHRHRPHCPWLAVPRSPRAAAIAARRRHPHPGTETPTAHPAAAARGTLSHGAEVAVRVARARRLAAAGAPPRTRAVRASTRRRTRNCGQRLRTSHRGSGGPERGEITRGATSDVVAEGAARICSDSLGDALAAVRDRVGQIGPSPPAARQRTCGPPFTVRYDSTEEGTAPQARNASAHTSTPTSAGTLSMPHDETTATPAAAAASP